MSHSRSRRSLWLGSDFDKVKISEILIASNPAEALSRIQYAKARISPTEIGEADLWSVLEVDASLFRSNYPAGAFNSRAENGVTENLTHIGKEIG